MQKLIYDTQRQCWLCLEFNAGVKPHSGFCATCQSNVDAALSDANKNGWRPLYDREKNSKPAFRKLMGRYREECASQAAPVPNSRRPSTRQRTTPRRW